MTNPRLVLIGWDAADRGTVEELMQQGALPILGALRDRGVWGRIAALPGLADDGGWASFATGTEPGAHGRFHHRQIVSGSYRLDNFFRDRMTGEPFWSQVGRAGRRVAVLDVPKSPLASGLNGIQLADWLPHGEDGPVPVSSPPSLADQLPMRLRARPGFSCHAVKTRADELQEVRERVRVHLDLRTELALDWLRRERWDLFLAVFAESHCAGHHCWHLHDATHPRHDREAARALGDPVRETYQTLDTAIGKLLAACEPDTTVMVFSLIGMGSTWTGSHLLDEALRRLDGQYSHYNDAAVRFADGLRALPSRLCGWLRSRAERPAAADAERACRKAFCVETDAVASAVRLNLVGREPQGQVRPEMYDDYCSFLASSLRALVDPDSGRPLVSEVIRVADRYPGPRVSALADLLVVWNAPAPIHAAASPSIGVVRDRPVPERSGNHRPGGWFVAAGPGIEPGELAAPAAIVDLAPTVGAILGVDLTGMEGVPILAATEQDRWNRRHDPAV